MPLLLEELKERLAQRMDEITLLELLEINAEDLCERFIDRIEEKFEKLEQEMEEE